MSARTKGRRLRRATACCGVLLGIILVGATHWTGVGASAEAFRRPDHRRVVEAFITTYIDRAQTSAELKQRLSDLAAGQQDFEARQELMPRVLEMIYPDFQAAMAALREEKAGDAAGMFGRLAASEDTYLADYSSYFLGRILVTDGRYEEAMPMLAGLYPRTVGKAFCDGDVLFLLGICQINTLQRPQALETLDLFLERYPDAPERLVVVARQLAEHLKAMDEGSIGDAQDRMGFSRRKLELEDVGKQTQDEQGRIIAILDKLIKDAEDKEQGGGGQGSSSQSGSPSGRQSRGRGGGQPQSPASRSTAPGGAARQGDLHGVGGKPQDAWGGLKDRQRQEVLDAIKAQFPKNYRELIEQYYKSLQEQPSP